MTPPRRPRLSTLALVASAALAGCGGGVVPDPGGTSPDVPLNCYGTECVPSDTLPTSAITAMMFVVDDGTRTQAQAGFNTDGSIFHNVELQGDELDFVDGATVTRMALARQGAWDFFGNLLTLGQPYLADISPQPATARDYAFRLVRAGGTLTSTVTLPAPFDITAPANNSAYAPSTTTIPVTLDAPEPVGDFSTTFTCTDSNGNQTGTRNASGSPFSATDGSGEAYAFSVPTFLASLDWSAATLPVGTVRSCNVTIHVLQVQPGSLAPGFHAFSVIQATQTRQVQVTLR
ncbi:MAG TPA: hypothetical protein VF457_09330 [Burkholderiaceae bacterium]